MPSLRAVGLVALFELSESLRSRRAVALLLLYLVVTAGCSAFCIHVLETIRTQLGHDVTAASSMVQSEPLVREIDRLIGDVEVTRTLVSLPPLALFYGWLALAIIPLLVVLTSSDVIASDRDTGAARFVLFRIDRLSWSLGKLAGQFALMIMGLSLGALGSYGLGFFLLTDFAPGPTAWWLARLTLRSSAYGFAYLGIALCASQWARTSSRARWLGLALLVGCWLMRYLLHLKVLSDAAPGLGDTLGWVLPSSHYMALWQPDIGARFAAIAALLLIGSSFFALGYIRFARQDA